VIEKARTACFNSGQRVEDHFVGIDEMVPIGSGAQRSVQTVMMSRYASACAPSRKPDSRTA
jgi:DNA-damage-inducible protein D